jgi:hypothetical protein
MLHLKISDISPKPEIGLYPSSYLYHLGLGKIPQILLHHKKGFVLIPIVFTRYHNSLLTKVKISAQELSQKEAPKIRRS